MKIGEYNNSNKKIKKFIKVIKIKLTTILVCTTLPPENKHLIEEGKKKLVCIM